MSWWIGRDGTVVDYDGDGPVEDEDGYMPVERVLPEHQRHQLEVGAAPHPTQWRA